MNINPTKSMQRLSQFSFLLGLYMQTKIQKNKKRDARIERRSEKLSHQIPTQDYIREKEEEIR